MTLLIAFFSSVSLARSSLTTSSSGLSVSEGAGPSSASRLLISLSLGRKETAMPSTSFVMPSRSTLSFTSSASFAALSVILGETASTRLARLSINDFCSLTVCAFAKLGDTSARQKTASNFRNMRRIKSTFLNQRGRRRDRLLTRRRGWRQAARGIGDLLKLRRRPVGFNGHG